MGKTLRGIARTSHKRSWEKQNGGSNRHRQTALGSVRKIDRRSKRFRELKLVQ